jgi:N-hydroxyarylamine O-acetyltransferase
VDRETLEAYCRRLGIEAELPSLEALRRIHRAHVERIPYETTWLHMGERWGVDPSDSVERIAHEGRGGYCFHLNGALSELLAALGYQVSRHIGGVHGPDGPAESAMTNHLALTVEGLAITDNPGGIWYVDAGLGDALYEPIPLLAGEYEQEPFCFVLTATPGNVGDWHFRHDPAGEFTGMSFRSASAAMADFAARNDLLSSSPSSSFTKVVTVQRRDASGVDILRGLVLSRVSSGPSRDSPIATRDEPVTARDDWFGVLVDVFDLRLDEVGPVARERLWTRVLTTHQAWEATRDLDR